MAALQTALLLIESDASLVRGGSGHAFYGQGDPADHWYRVVSGAARESALFRDGRRQIVQFLLPGDFFAFSATRTHSLTAEAVSEDTVVARYPRRSIEKLARVDTELRSCLLGMARDAVSRLHARMVVLGSLSAEQRVGVFLSEMERRGPEGADVLLPMSRGDIADYLGLSVETVSRALTSLRQRGVISLAAPHRVRILQRKAIDPESLL